MLRKAADIYFHGKNTTRKLVCRSSARDIECPEARATKGACGRVGGRQSNHTVNLTAWVDSDQTPSTVTRIP